MTGAGGGPSAPASSLAGSLAAAREPGPRAHTGGSIGYAAITIDGGASGTA